ncbi:hypothetical protein SAMN04488574_102388 [Bacillus sp. 71mf]|nr:hypothetical protein SAMN04488574_102388 [Bacillus sp. 71mf]SFS36218.1 hypothetical protein SAMN04488145_10177 [Bacillus sp. 103mf]
MGKSRQRSTTNEIIVYDLNLTKMKFLQYSISFSLWLYIIMFGIFIIMICLKWNMEYTEFLLFLLNTNPSHIRIMMFIILAWGILSFFFIFLWNTYRSYNFQSKTKRQVWNMEQHAYMTSRFFNLTKEENIYFQTETYIEIEYPLDA